MFVGDVLLEVGLEFHSEIAMGAFELGLFAALVLQVALQAHLDLVAPFALAALKREIYKTWD